MKTLGRRSLASFLRVALRATQVILYIATPLALLGCMIAVARTYGAEIGWMDMPAAPAPIFAWNFTVRVAVWLACAIIVVTKLRAIFATLAAGDPFVPENAGHLRIIAVTLAAGELARYALNAVREIAMSTLNIPQPEWMQDRLVTVSIGVWFAVLTVLVLSEVFREGARMRQEQQFTI